MTCKHCNAPIEDDEPSPFCHTCWVTALHSGNKDAEQSILKWIARID